MHFFEVLQLKVNLCDKAPESNCTYMYFSYDFNELFSSVKAPLMNDILFNYVTYLPVLSICDFDLYI